MVRLAILDVAALRDDGGGQRVRAGAMVVMVVVRAAGAGRRQRGDVAGAAAVVRAVAVSRGGPLVRRVRRHARWGLVVGCVLWGVALVVGAMGGVREGERNGKAGVLASVVPVQKHIVERCGDRGGRWS